MMTTGVVNLAYLIGAICFIVAFKMLSSPRIAARGNGDGGGRLTAEMVIARNLLRDIELELERHQRRA